MEGQIASPYETGDRTWTAEQRRSFKALENILERTYTRPFSARLLKKAIAWAYDEAPELVSILLRHNIHHIDEEIAMIAAGSFHGAEMMAMLLNYNEDLIISDNIMLEAAKNDKHKIQTSSSDHVMDVLLRQKKHPNVTEKVIKAAALQHTANPSLVELLLEHSDELAISDELITTVAEIDGDGAPITQLLMNHRAMPVTEKAIEASLRNPYYATDVLRVLLAHGSEAPINQEILDRACAIEDDPGVLDILAGLRGCTISGNHPPQHKDLAVLVLDEDISIPIQDPQSCPTCLDLCSPPNRKFSLDHKDFTSAELCASVKAGCRFCAVIRQSVELTLRAEPCQCWIIQVSWAHADLLIVWVRSKSPEECCTNLFSGEYVRDFEGIEIYMHAGTRVFSPVVGVARSISPDASTNQCMALANDWVKDCIANHPMCSSPSKPLPSRVIKVGSEQVDPALHITDGNICAQYAALSHCWGDSHVLTTTTATIEDRKQGLPMINLPKTFSDAILITRRLGIEYLWIDSLCILQDSSEDWAREAANMAAVYSGATVVIAADAAERSTDGCFVPYQESRGKNLSVTIPCVDDQGLDCQVYARRRMQRSGHDQIEHRPLDYSHAPASPLNLRGWALQERLLAPRILHYGSTELAWECWSQVNCECTPIPEKIDYDVQYHKQYRVGKVGKMALAHHDLADHKEINSYDRQHWRSLVSDFTSRGLTYHCDRLAALSGLASKLQGPSDEYISGLWRSDFARDMMWYVRHTDVSRPSYPQEAYMAPSWSWAAVTGEVNFASSYDHEDDVEILDIEYTLASSNPFGALSWACVTARGHLLPIWLDANFNIHFITGDPPDDFGWQEWDITPGKVYLDVTSGEKALQEVIVRKPLVLLIVRRCKSTFGSQGIVLRAVQDAPRPNAFQRIGYWTSWSSVRSVRDALIELAWDTAERQVFTCI